jgi:hypothetical protein
VLTLARWTALCAAAETVGMTAAAGAAKAAQAVVGATPAGGETALGLSIVVAGGLVEGVALGAAQATGLRRLVPALDGGRWVLVTVAVAGLGWAAVSAPAALGGADDAGAGAPPLPLLLAGAAALGIGMGAVLGGAQALVLRGRVPRPGRWVAANAVAWAPAMSVIFLGATTPDSDWSVASVLGLGALTGAVAGTVLGLVTGRFLPSVTGRAMGAARPRATLQRWG